ncbi:MAG: hypothetical protein AABY64_03600 [Bdellovibrionota bacterium]
MDNKTHINKKNRIFSKMAFGLVVGLLLTGVKSIAGFSNYNSILIGDLSAGMGGAATAVVGDSSGSAFYNPATLAQLEGDSFSAAVGIYKKFDTVFGENEDFTKAPLRVNQGYFRSLPASTGNVLRLGKYNVALSILVPDFEEFKGDLKKQDENATTLSVTDESLWVGAGVAQSISETESAGVSAYYTARSFSRSLNDRTYPSATRAQLYTEEKTLVENAVLFIFGYYKKLSDKAALGLSLRSPAVKIASHANVFRSNTTVDTSVPSMTRPTENYPDEGSRVVIPGKLAIGLSYQQDPTLLWAADVSLHEGISYIDIINESIGSRVDHKSVWNAAIGVEKAFRDWLKVRIGAYTNFSSHHEPNPDFQQLQEDKVDMLGFSANVVFIAGKKISYTFGGYYTGGRGRSIQRIQQQYEIVTKNQNVFTMLVGTAFHF